MGYPTKLLADDEHIAFELRPHWKALIAPALVFLAVLAGGVYLLAKVSSWDGQAATDVRWFVGLVMVGLFLWWVLRPLAYWYTTLYVVTNRRIITRYGLLARNGRNIPLSRVNDVSFSHNVIDQMLNCGTLTVESAGERGQLVMRAVPDAETLQRDIYRLQEEDDARRRGLGQTRDEPDSANDEH
mgnify:CR=1 FL=1